MVALATLVLQLALSAAAAQDAPTPAAEVIEELDDVQVVDASAGTPAQSTETDPGFADRISRFHPALVHFPIAWLVILLLIDLLTLLLRKPWERAGAFVAGLAVLSCVPALVTGVLRGAHHPGGAEIHTLIESHELLAFTSSGLALVAVMMRLWRRNDLRGAWRWGYLALLGAAVVLIGLTGHRGGALVFGAAYLPF